MGKKQHAAAKKHKQRGDQASAADGGTGKTERQKGSKQQRRRNKEHHWAVDDLERELAALGLRIKTIEADGNCFFRSVLDQMKGEGGDHMRLRGQVMDFLEEREEEYKFFIEDDEPFDKYIRRMRKDGAWAGHLEVQATSMLLKRNISIYQSGQPVWHVDNFGPDCPVLHLSYHDGMHYNSVRSAIDYGSGPPEPTQLANGNSVGSSGGGIEPADPAAVARAARSFGGREVEQVVMGTGCMDRERVAGVLDWCGGNLDQAIEVLIEQLGAEEEAEETEQATKDVNQQQQQHRKEEEDGNEVGAAEKVASAVASIREAAPGRQQLELVHQQREEEGVPAVLPVLGAPHAAACTKDCVAGHHPQQYQAGAGGAPGVAGHPVRRQQVADAERHGPADSDSWVQLELRPQPGDSRGSMAVVLHVHPSQQQEQQQKQEQLLGSQRVQQDAGELAEEAPEEVQPPTSSKRASASGKRGGIRVREGKTVLAGRNRRCPCGSTKKYKNCCGALRGESGAAKVRRAAAVAAADGDGNPAASSEVAKQLQVLHI